MNRKFYLISFISLIILLIGTGPVQAYYLNLDAPSEVRVGEEINVTVTTNVPPPDTIDLVFSHSINIPVEIARTTYQVTEKGDTTFNATIPTEGLEKGNYKLEGLSESKRDFSAGSRSLRVIKLIDRSDLVKMTSQAYQEIDEAMTITGRITDYTDNAVQMEVKLGEENIFGPESIPVTNKNFSEHITVTKAGKYQISFNDYAGYIGTYVIEVVDPDPVKPEVEATHVQSEPASDTTVGLTTAPTTVPTTTNATVDEKIENATTHGTDVPSESLSTGGEALTLKTEISRDSPAYIMVSTAGFPLSIKTSDNEDFVIEYMYDKEGAPIKVNDKLGKGSEELTINDEISNLYLKVYPNSYSVSGKVEITANQAKSIELSDDAADAFNAPPRYGTKTETSTQSPLPVWLVLIGLVCALLINRR